MSHPDPAKQDADGHTPDHLARPEVSCTLTSHPKFLPLVRAIVQEGANLAGFDAEGTQEVLLAVTEAVANER